MTTNVTRIRTRHGTRVVYTVTQPDIKYKTTWLSDLHAWLIKLVVGRKVVIANAVLSIAPCSLNSAHAELRHVVGSVITGNVFLSTTDGADYQIIIEQQVKP